ncbi:hypothetical protein KSP40_PGU021439 [Platanthera guangdongensis]|uniref:Uncharacterized protein n=1 Tax=Platanthera guangdongensis TaxID=2320717 RepID=A0ABR2M2M6_9ASPA
MPSPSPLHSPALPGSLKNFSNGRYISSNLSKTTIQAPIFPCISDRRSPFHFLAGDFVEAFGRIEEGRGEWKEFFGETTPPGYLYAWARAHHKILLGTHFLNRDGVEVSFRVCDRSRKEQAHSWPKDKEQANSFTVRSLLTSMVVSEQSWRVEVSPMGERQYGEFPGSSGARRLGEWRVASAQYHQALATKVSRPKCIDSPLRDILFHFRFVYNSILVSH